MAFYHHTYTDPVEAFAHFTEMNLATLEGLPKAVSQRERARLQHIADEMVRHCKLFRVESDSFRNTPRLNELLIA